MWRDLTRSLAVVALLAVVTAPATAQTFGAVADTFVDSDLDTMNFGDFTFAEAGVQFDKGAVQRALLAFDLSSLPSGAPIESARLLLTISFTNEDPLNLPITVASLAAPFDEGTVTWQTQPAVAPGPTAMGIMSTPAGEVFSIDVTALVVAQRAGMNPDDILLRIAATNEAEMDERFFDFRTKEFEDGSLRARLVIGLAGVPAPLLSGWMTVVVLVGLMLVGGSALLRRQP